MGDEGCHFIYQQLKDHSYINTLDLKGNNIGEIGIIAIGKLLRENHVIKRLNLEWNCLGSSETAMQNLCDAVRENASLQEIDLKNN